MDGIKTIDELIKAKKLTPEEQEKLREIIEECRIRETQIQEASDATQQNLESLSRSFGLIAAPSPMWARPWMSCTKKWGDSSSR